MGHEKPEPWEKWLDRFILTLFVVCGVAITTVWLLVALVVWGLFE